MRNTLLASGINRSARVGRSHGSAGHYCGRGSAPCSLNYSSITESPGTPASRCLRSTSARGFASIPKRRHTRPSWAPLDGVSAHPKVDPATGELMFFNYSKHAPYMHYGVVDRNGRLTSYTPIALPGPRLPHDMAITARHSILNDLPAFWDRDLLASNVHAVRMHDLPARFGVIPRHGRAEELRWFEAAPTYVLHFLNAYEQGDEIVMDGYFQENPTPRRARTRRSVTRT